MKAIIMAAGQGTRISGKINGVPKSTLLVGDEPLIAHTVKMLLQRNIDICVVVGYRQQEVLDCLVGLSVTVVHNPFHAVTNSLASLWLAREFWGDDDMLLLNADLLMDDAILNQIIAEPRSPVMGVDPSRIEVGDFFFSYTSAQHLTLYGKGMPIEHRCGEYLGIAKVQKKDRPACLDALDELMFQQRYDDWWERVLYHQVESGRYIHVMEICGAYWAEIDSYEDYQGIQAFFEGKTRVRYG